MYLETGDPNRPLGWSSFKNYNQLLGANVRVPTIKVRAKMQIWK